MGWHARMLEHHGLRFMRLGAGAKMHLVGTGNLPAALGGRSDGGWVLSICRTGRRGGGGTWHWK